MLEAPLPSTGIVIRRVFTLERGLFAAPSLMERYGEPRTLEDLAKLPLLAGPSDTRLADHAARRQGRTPLAWRRRGS